MEDQELLWLEQARRGDQEHSRLVEAYQRPVYNLCYRMLSNAPEAEDAAQGARADVHQAAHVSA